MKQYLDLLDYVIKNGVEKDDRTGTGTYAVFGYQMRFNLQDGFPLLTTKKLYTRAIIHELLWFLSGNINIKYLQDNNVHIWDPWADEDGYLPRIYGYQWRNFGGEYIPFGDNRIESFPGIDQIAEVVRSLREKPDSRRHIVTSWNPIDLPYMPLPPCHCLFQFFVANNKLSCQLYQRSCDMFLGVPFNIASYALLTHMMAQVCGYDVGEFIWTGGDVHIYKNHINQAKEQLSRDCRELPTLRLNEDIQEIWDFKYEDILIENYNPHPPIKAEISV